MDFPGAIAEQGYQGGYDSSGPEFPEDEGGMLPVTGFRALQLLQEDRYGSAFIRPRDAAMAGTRDTSSMAPRSGRTADTIFRSPMRDIARARPAGSSPWRREMSAASGSSCIVTIVPQ
jgi:hypothetical protein